MANKQKFKGSTLYRKRCVDNIIKVYNNPKFEGGSSWYNDAHELANSLAKQFGLTTLQVAGIISAFSPLKSWDENKKIAKQFLTNGNGKHTKVMKQKAIDIKLYNSTLEREFILTTLNGNKISNFFLNIAYPNESTSVTIDRHAIAVILGRNATENEGKGITDAQYEFLASCYRQASEILGVIPNQVQSVTWVKWRKLKNENKFADVPF
jgi:hypothetical protein